MKRLFILAGELSGDAHCAGLMRAILDKRPDTHFSGFGGPQMRGVGGNAILDWVEDAGVVGLWEVLKMYGWFKQKMDEALAIIREEKPDAVILADYPGFNLRLAKTLRQQGYEKPILYYISPQVWAWKKGRVKTMAKVLNLMICIFPFEKELYEKSGLPTVYSGHPVVDRVKTLQRGWQRERGLVGFFPGSRANEVRRLLPVILETAGKIRASRPDARFAISAANERLASIMRQMMDETGHSDARAWIEVGSVYDLMQRAEVGAVASGTATLEAACFGLPYVLIYKVNALTYAVAKSVVRIRFLGIVNVLAGEPVVKELIQADCSPPILAGELLHLLHDEAARLALTTRLAEVVAQLGPGGAYQRAADAIDQYLSDPTSLS